MSVEPIKGVLSAYTNPLYGTLASELLRGYSAYNIAVMEGYEGTIDEWLESLIGPKGDKGDQGDPGLDGEQGPRGYTGETGPKGDKGEKGDKGDTGNGIYAVVLRADYTLSIYFTDGSVYNTPSIRGREGAVGPAGPVGPQGETGAKGDKGDTGDAGTGISSIVQNADHSLTINLDDGTSYTTDPVEALKGDKGDTGNGISSIVMKSDYTLQINMTNGTSYTTPSIRGVAGAKGDKGDKGDTGATGPQGPKGDPGALNFHICSQTEYDSTTRVPTVQNPEDDTFYLVPSASVTSPDLFVEWIYVNNAWEMFGSATVDISGKADKVSNATSGNFASLDSNGNLVDSGHSFSEINQELTSVKSDLNDLTGKFSIQIGKNMYDASKDVAGYISAGTVTPHASWKTSDFIDVSKNSKVFLSAYVKSASKRAGIPMGFMCEYDGTQTLVASKTMVQPPYTVPNGVSFIRFSYEFNLYENLMLESGEGFSTYEPYHEYDVLINTKNKSESKWIGKKWVAVGDSLTAVNSRTTIHYHDYIKDDTGINVVNMGVSGTGYARGDSSNFYTRIENVPTDADVVTIFGSGNDIGSGLPIGNISDAGTESLCGYINGTIDKLIARIPTVSLGIVSPTPWVGYAPSDSTNAMYLYSKALKEICEARSIPFLDLYHCSNLRPWTAEGRTACYSKDDGDGVHPDENGHKLIAPRFKAFLQTLLL